MGVKLGEAGFSAYLSFAVHVAQQEDAQDDGDHVPLGEDEAGGQESAFGTMRNERRVWVT